MDDETLKYIEAEGAASLAGHHQDADMIRAEANTTLHLLLGGAGAALGFGLTQLPGPAGCASLAACAFLFWLTHRLQREVLEIGNYPAEHCEPRSLLRGMEHRSSAAELRRAALDVTQGAIDDCIPINDERTKALNAIRRHVPIGGVLAFVVWAAAYLQA